MFPNKRKLTKNDTYSTFKKHKAGKDGITLIGVNKNSAWFDGCFAADIKRNADREQDRFELKLIRALKKTAIKKLLKAALTAIIVLTLSMVATQSYADYRIYAGQDDLGKIYAGIEATLPIQEARLMFDIKSTGLHNSYTTYEINGDTYKKTGEVKTPFFVPSDIIYTAELRFNNIVLGHKCYHKIDTISDDISKVSPMNYIEIQTNF